MLRSGRRGGTLRYPGSASEAARMLISALEGAMLIARPYGDLQRFQVAARHHIATFTTRADS